MDIVYEPSMDLREYFKQNKDSFEERLLKEAVNVRDKIEEIRVIGNINLLDNAHRLVMYVIEEREPELVDFAVQEGKAWARHSLTLAFNLNGYRLSVGHYGLFCIILIAKVEKWNRWINFIPWKNPLTKGWTSS